LQIIISRTEKVIIKYRAASKEVLDLMQEIEDLEDTGCEVAIDAHLQLSYDNIQANTTQTADEACILVNSTYEIPAGAIVTHVPSGNEYRVLYSLPTLGNTTKIVLDRPTEETFTDLDEIEAVL